VVASSGAVSVALDATLTPELVAEGHAREFVSVLQQARKDAGLDISDRIRVTWDSEDAELVAAITTHAAYIADEVLAVEFTRGTGTQAAEVNGRAIRFSLTKA